MLDAGIQLLITQYLYDAFLLGTEYSLAILEVMQNGCQNLIRPKDPSVKASGGCVAKVPPSFKTPFCCVINRYFRVPFRGRTPGQRPCGRFDRRPLRLHVSNATAKPFCQGHSFMMFYAKLPWCHKGFSYFLSSWIVSAESQRLLNLLFILEDLAMTMSSNCGMSPDSPDLTRTTKSFPVANRMSIVARFRCCRLCVGS